MLKRTITGACFVAVIVASFLLREFVDYRLFNLLTWFFCAVGTFELARALKPFALKFAFIPTVIFGIIFVPCYSLIEHFFAGYGYVATLILIATFVLITLIACLINKSLKKFVPSALPFVYPALLMLTMLLANGLYNGFIALLLIFVISPCSDTFAYLVGSRIGGKKLCPKLSPKKTWSGAIGGVIGGAVGSILVYFIFMPTVNFFSPILLFILLGIVGSIFTIIGDLFESYIKRRVGIKDMGRIMPGHGGIMDRIDGISFASVLIYFVLLVV